MQPPASGHIQDSHEPPHLTSAELNERNAREARRHVERTLREQISVTKFHDIFPDSRAGEVIGHESNLSSGYNVYGKDLGTTPANVYAPFASQMDWEVARWAKMRGPGSNAFSELLNIPDLADTLGLSYNNSRGLNQMIDKLPTSRPRFQRRRIKLGGDLHDVYFRDVLECIRALYSEPEFAPHLQHLPERHYADEDKTKRLYHEMYVGKWWWNAQKAVEAKTPGATIIPVMISSDKTQIALIGNKTAYPVYLTIGNLPKEIRRKPSQRSHILLGYLPAAKLDSITNQASRRRCLANLFHASMRIVFSPMKKAGEKGVAMTSGDGVTRRTHPIHAVYSGDYLEHVLVTGTKYGQCPVCTIPHNELGDHGADYPLRDLQAIVQALQVADTAPGRFLQACQQAGVKPIYRPFWVGLPYTDIFYTITPDLLHQLHQGLIKHLFSWVKQAYNKSEIDARCRRLPPNHSIRYFAKGITPLTKLTGREHNDIARILLGLVAGMRLPNNKPTDRLVASVRAMLDYLFLCQYPIHSTQTLDLLDDALQRFHESKSIFIDLGIREHFNFPKLHFADHNRTSIENLGSLDNFTAEYTERLHIDYAKDAYDATNHKDIYPQMTLWLERKEKVMRHEKYIQWHLHGCPPATSLNDLTVNRISPKMTKHPTHKSVTLNTLMTRYGAKDFELALAVFAVQHDNPGISFGDARQQARSITVPVFRIPVYHKARFWNVEFGRYRNASNEYDVVHARIAGTTRHGNTQVARFDTVLVNDGTGEDVGIAGMCYRVAQVRVIFTIPSYLSQHLFRSNRPPPKYFAYVEWFTKFNHPDPVHGMYKISRSMSRGERTAAIIPLENIRRSIHLFPVFGASVSQEWSSENVLEECTSFYVNSYTDRHVFGTLI
ncbi:hypothetical protein K474DRAFT_1593052 [Panus rudis PR-1116 ss-1]|nr:hypothetical protein K474DRAFT_1593052 [Panus rudis PR-1116 ss-1]